MMKRGKVKKGRKTSIREPINRLHDFMRENKTRTYGSRDRKGRGDKSKKSGKFSKRKKNSEVWGERERNLRRKERPKRKSGRVAKKL